MSLVTTCWRLRSPSLPFSSVHPLDFTLVVPGKIKNAAPARTCEAQQQQQQLPFPKIDDNQGETRERVNDMREIGSSDSREMPDSRSVGHAARDRAHFFLVSSDLVKNVFRTVIVSYPYHRSYHLYNLSQLYEYTYVVYI